MRLAGRAALAAIGGVAASGIACELITGAGEFAVYDGLCYACPASEGLRHPPCPRPSDAPDTAARWVFAGRQMYFGKPDQWRASPQTFSVGYDLDCSDRKPTGAPVLCRPREVDGKAIPFELTPSGIDNALSTRIFGPLYDTAEAAGVPVDLDAELAQGHELGTDGLIVTVEGWNATPDDPEVTFSILSSPGTTEDSRPPRWDGTDEWLLYDDLPGNESKFFKMENVAAYVSGGVLVVDYRSRGDVSFRFGSPKRSFRIVIREVSFVGRIAPDGIRELTMLALADYATTFEAIPELAKVLSGCDAVAEGFLNGQLEDLLTGAADMPSVRGGSAAEPCDAFSFSWAFDAWPAAIAGFGQPAVEQDAGCL